MPKHNWTWQFATGTDVIDIKDIAQTWFEREIDQIFDSDPIAYMHNITQAIVNQYYAPGSELIQVAKDDHGRIVGYVWVKRGHRAPWSNQEMAVVQMVHVDMSLGARQRVALVKDMIMIWETWCIQFGIPIACSTTMRGDQMAFLRIHAQQGYDVRGSYAYKRIL